jgi:type I restriction enzyme M protein
LPNSVFQPYATVSTNLLFFEKGKPTSKIWYWEHKLPEGQKSYSKTKTIRVEEFNELKNWWMKRIENEQAWKVDIKTIEENGYNLDIKNPFRQEEKQQYSSAELLEMLHMSFEKSNQLLDQLKMVMK